MMKAEFVFYFDTEEEAKIIFESLIPEIKHKIPKTDVKINLENGSINLKIETKDINSLRAACNSYLRWLDTALKVKKVI